MLCIKANQIKTPVTKIHIDLPSNRQTDQFLKKKLKKYICFIIEMHIVCCIYLVKELFCVSLRNLSHNNNLPDSYKYDEISMTNRPSKLGHFALKFQY